jgi:hypothetical protein
MRAGKCTLILATGLNKKNNSGQCRNYFHFIVGKITWSLSFQLS